MWDPRFQEETDGNYVCETISGGNMAREPLTNPVEGEIPLEVESPVDDARILQANAGFG
jgi:hypothetical protein